MDPTLFVDTLPQYYHGNRPNSYNSSFRGQVRNFVPPVPTRVIDPYRNLGPDKLRPLLYPWQNKQYFSMANKNCPIYAFDYDSGSLIPMSDLI